MYYGAFPGAERDLLGAPATLWIVSRPHNWHPATSQEWLLQLDLETGRQLGKVLVGALRGAGRCAGCSVGAGAGMCLMGGSCRDPILLAHMLELLHTWLWFCLRPRPAARP